MSVPSRNESANATIFRNAAFALPDIKEGLITLGVGVITWKIIGAVLPIFPLIGMAFTALATFTLYFIGVAVLTGDKFDSSEAFRKALGEGTKLVSLCNKINHTITLHLFPRNN